MHNSLRSECSQKTELERMVQVTDFSISRVSAPLPLQEELQLHDLSHQPLTSFWPERLVWGLACYPSWEGRLSFLSVYHPGHWSHRDRKEQWWGPERGKGEGETWPLDSIKTQGQLYLGLAVVWTFDSITPLLLFYLLELIWTETLSLVTRLPFTPRTNIWVKMGAWRTWRGMDAPNPDWGPEGGFLMEMVPKQMQPATTGPRATLLRCFVPLYKTNKWLLFFPFLLWEVHYIHTHT